MKWVLVLLAIGLAACGSGEIAEDSTATTRLSSTTVISEGPMVVTTTTVPSTTQATTAAATTASDPLVEVLAPSQTLEDAQRDGIVPEIAELPYLRRVNAELEVASDQGTWVLATLSDVVQEESRVNGCGIGNLDGIYPIEVVCASEYGEILLVDDEAIIKAFPMPGAVPSWVHITEDSVYSGRIGDGGLPDSTLVKIDRVTLQATVVVIPAPFDGVTEWLPGWHIAPDGYSDRYYNAIHINSNEPGTPVSSWIGDFTVDLETIDAIIEEVTAS